MGNRQERPATAGDRPLGERIRLLRENTRGLAQFVGSRLPADNARRQAFDQLHRQLEFLRGSLVDQDPGRLFLGMMLLYDDLGRAADKHQASRKAAGRLAGLQQRVLQLLNRYGVTMIDSRETFDASCQRAVQTEPTDRRAEDQRIRRVVREGFRHGPRVLRPQEVVVLRYREDATDG